jgi:hypothetical protein
VKNSVFPIISNKNAIRRHRSPVCRLLFSKATAGRNFYDWQRRTTRVSLWVLTLFNYDIFYRKSLPVFFLRFPLKEKSRQDHRQEACA